MARQLAGWLAGKGVNGVFVAGTTGEGLLLDLDERKKLLEAVHAEVAGRIAVYVQVGCASTADSIKLAEHAAKLGVNGVVILSPFFYAFDRAAMSSYFTAIAAAIPQTPVFLYNIPENTRNNITPEIVQGVRSQAPNVAGIKDSSKDLTLFQKYVGLGLESFASIVGSDSVLLPGLAAGGHGVVSAASNVFPEIVVSVVSRFEAGDLSAARAAQGALNGALGVLKLGPIPAGYKAGLALRGLDVGGVRPPLRDLTAEEKHKFAEAFERLPSLAG
jgi:4-hydroxy-tetrahydrodipicolinate synthase